MEEKKNQLLSPLLPKDNIILSGYSRVIAKGNWKSETFKIYCQIFNSLFHNIGMLSDSKKKGSF